MRSWRSRPARETQTSGANQPNPAVSTTSSGEDAEQRQQQERRAEDHRRAAL